MEDISSFSDGSHKFIPDEALKADYDDYGDNVAIRFYLDKFTADGRYLPDEVAAMIELEAGQTYLDLGCGVGNMVLDLARKSPTSATIVGIDSQPSQIETAKENAEAQKISNAEFLVGDMDELCIEDNSVDVVTANYSLYLSDLGKSLPEIKRVLKPDGTAYLSTSGSRHKRLMRGIEEVACQVAGLYYPGRQNETFTINVARQVLKLVFSEVEEHQPQYTDLIIDNETSLVAYCYSAYTIKARILYQDNLRYNYTPEQFMSRKRSINRIIFGPPRTSRQPVIDQIRHTIQTDGAWRDEFERSVFICKP